MKISSRNDGPAAVLSLQGKIMTDSDVSEFMDAVKASMYEKQPNIVVDFEGVDWINSSGLGMLIAAQDLLREVDGKLRLASLSEPVAKLINLNRLDLVFRIYPTVDAAKVGAD